jgi:hypothetical protein
MKTTLKSTECVGWTWSPLTPPALTTPGEISATLNVTAEAAPTSTSTTAAAAVGESSAAPNSTAAADAAFASQLALEAFTMVLGRHVPRIRTTLTILDQEEEIEEEEEEELPLEDSEGISFFIFTFLHLFYLFCFLFSPCLAWFFRVCLIFFF